MRSRCWCPTPARALALLRAELRPGDVVLVKASRSVGLETVATACWPTSADGPAEGGRRVRQVLLAAAVALVVSLFGTPLCIRFLVRAGLRPVHPRRRPDRAPHQARHADDGRRRHHRRPRCSATSVAHADHRRDADDRPACSCCS